MLDSVNLYLFNKEFQYTQSVQRSIESDNWAEAELLSRVKLVALSIFNAVLVLWDVVYMVSNGIAALVFAAVHCKSPIAYCSNVRNILLVFTEFLRHAGGMLAGSVIGIAHPKTAVKYLLPPDQSCKANLDSNMTPNEAGKLYAMLKVVDELFQANQIEYRMVGGTMLGAHRHGGIIPWDDDADLGMLKEDEEKLLKLVPHFNKLGLALIKCPNDFGYKLYDLKGKELPEDQGLKYNYPFVDLFFMEKIDDRFVYSCKQIRDCFAGEYFLEDEWNVKSRVQFGPISLFGLEGEPAKLWCERGYGKGVMDYGFQLFSHKDFGISLPRKFGLKKEMDSNKCEPIEFDKNIFNSAFL